jgi:hypothetical protein
MSGSYSKSKGRRDTGTFFQLPHAVLKCENYVNLSHIARSMLLELELQFNGKNNGDLVATWSVLEKRGWASKTTIKKHIGELRHYGFIILVQQGGTNAGGTKRPNLYALTWLRIDKVGYSDGFVSETDLKVGDIDSGWRVVKPPYYPPKKKRKCPSELVKAKNLSPSSCTSTAPVHVLEVGNYAQN